MKTNYEVIIIGGGPAGSVLGAYLSREGVDCVIFEKEIFPRPHVGESLVPSTNLVFKELGILPLMEEAGFVKKYGAIWTSEKNNKVFGHDFDELDENYQIDIQFKERKQEGISQNYTYHVDRAKFDKILLDHSKKLGTTVFEGHRIISSDFSNEGVNVKVRNLENQEFSITGQILVDASGRNTFIGSKLNWKIKDPVFNQYAVHSWFEGYERTNQEKENITIHFLPVTNSWIWQIPITETITSFGVVAQKEHFSRFNDDLEKYFWDMVSTRPDFHSKLKQSKKIREFVVEGDYSYSMKEFTADRLLLVGDAARFVDPIFSSGVNIAIQSARFASKDIINSLSKNDFSKKQFEPYRSLMDIGCKNWHDFITLYYRLNVMFTYFLEKKEYRLDVLKFLQGDVYDEAEPKLIKAMKSFVEGIENNPKHPLHDYLSDLTGNQFS